MLYTKKLVLFLSSDPFTNLRIQDHFKDYKELELIIKDNLTDGVDFIDNQLSNTLHGRRLKTIVSDIIVVPGKKTKHTPRILKPVYYLPERVQQAGVYFFRWIDQHHRKLFHVTRKIIYANTIQNATEFDNKVWIKANEIIHLEKTKSYDTLRKYIMKK